ncbi:MAG: phosphoglycerate kinase [Erysipelotrichaceae bacterium]|nr:phosphoglycerate kinase [Erysipelotrichaceae bacterium]
MAKQTVKDLDVRGKRVIVRVDFNVPLKDGVITNDNRIQAALPTINYLVENGARIILMSHLGKIDHKDPEKCEAGKKKNNMAPVAVRLAELVDTKVEFCSVTRGAELEEKVAALKDGEIVLVQNTRYEKGESKNDPELAKYWASLGELFVSDAFGSVHRAHASTVGIPSILPSALGFLVQKEVENLSAAIDNPKRPMVAILGGAKVSDKIAVIENLLNIADKVIIGGGMAYTFKKAQGYTIGNSLLEEDKVELAKSFLDKANGKIILPVDTVCSTEFSEETPSEVYEGNIPDGWMGLDIGPKSVELFKQELEGAKTVVWNGPMGVFEMAKYAVGTESVCKAISELPDAITVIGGGDSAAAAIKLGYKEKFTHISTGGGASLEYMEGKVLPGIDIIQEKA